MRTHGHATTWGTHIGVARDAKGWYEHLKEWWAAQKAARHEAKFAALTARWDAKQEALKSRCAEAAADMVAAEHAFSTTSALCALSV